MTNMKNFILPVLCSFVIILASCKKDDDPATPDTTVVSKTGLVVNTSQEAPAVTVPSSATGTMDVSYNKTTKILTYSVTWLALSDSIVSSHIHGTAARGVAAPVKVPFTVANKGALAGTFSGTTTIDGVLIKEDSLLLGFYYLNIHTKKNPGGEIRGQIEFK